MAARMEPTYLDGLNPEQARAIETLDGPVLVLAGAGTGKTRVLTTRIAHILATGSAYPSQILAVTFTNKAAREMKERIGGFVGEAIEGMPWLGTFHAIGVRILRRHHELVGLKSGFTILDTDDQIRLLKQVIEAENIDKDRWPARQLAGLIDDWKNRGLTPEKVPKGEAFAFANGQGGKLYAAYQARLKGAECYRFRRPPAGVPAALSRAPGRACLIINAASATSWSMNTRTPTLPNTYGCASWHKARQTSAALVTMTSRSTVGAERRSTTSCGSKRISPAPR